MKKFYYYFICLFFLSSCSSKKIDNDLTAKHKYVSETNSFIIPPANYKKATTINGFSDIEEKWNLSINSSEKDLATIIETYSEKNLRKGKRRLIKKEDIIYNDSLKGVYVEYTSSKIGKTNGRYNVILAIDRNKDRQIVKSWFSEYSLESCLPRMIKSMNSIYIGEDDQIQKEKLKKSLPDKSVNVYGDASSKFVFAGELDGNYYYTKDGIYPTLSKDSAYIYFRPIWNFIPSRGLPNMMTEILGEDYEVIDKVDDNIMRGKRSVYWTAKNKSKSKLGFGGYYWNKNINKVQASCVDSFETNLQSFNLLMKKIKMK